MTLNIDDIDIHPLAPLRWAINDPSRGVRPLVLAKGKYGPPDPDLGLLSLATPWNFFHLCAGIADDDTPINFETLPQQKHGFLHAHKYRWSFFDKYRQAKFSTWIADGMLLRDCMLFHGMRGLLIAERQETAEDLFERIVYAFERLPDGLKVPLAEGRSPGVKQILFKHGGGIKVITGSGWSPGVGRSIGRLHLSEFGEVPPERQSMLVRNLLPTVNRRPNARVWIETTPGRSGTVSHTIWQGALAGEGRFSERNEGAPCFLEWWLDPTCTTPLSEGFRRTEEEEEYVLRLHGLPGGRSVDGAKEITDGHLQFRRDEIATTFERSPRLFDTKYPPNPASGWIGSDNPVLPETAIEHQMQSQAPDGSCSFNFEAGLSFVEPDWQPDLMAAYLLTVDPKRAGTGGDPAAVTLWETFGEDSDMVEVGFWEGREDPHELAHHVAKTARWIDENKIWKGLPDRHPLLRQHPDKIHSDQVAIEREGDKPLVVVESVTDGTISVLRTDEFQDLFTYCGRKQDGWYTTNKLLREATGHAVHALHNHGVIARSGGLLQQLHSYDGRNKHTRVAQTDGSKHHYDRARTFVMACHINATWSFETPTVKIVANSADEEYIPVAFRNSSSDKKRDRYNPRLPYDWRRED